MQFILVTLVASILVLSQGEPISKPILDPIVARQGAIDEACGVKDPNSTGKMSEDNSCKFSCVDAKGTTVVESNNLPNFAPCTMTEDEPLKGQCYEGQCEKAGTRPQPRKWRICAWGNFGCYHRGGR